MTDLLVIQHEPDTPPGTVLEWAQSRNIQFKIWEIWKNPYLYSPQDVRAVVICGGTMDTCQEDEFPWLRQEKDFLKSCLELSLPVFGLCLGSQLIAESLGAKVYSMNKWEVGFVPVDLLDSSAQTKNSTLKVFHWHQYTFDLPAGARLIATNSFCVNQAFAFGKKIRATQFHPEAGEQWIRQCAEEVDGRNLVGNVQCRAEILVDLKFQKELQEWFFSQLDEWYSNC